jgi:membrane-bound metal-dependent hydrolase YbcI (DUF457 family)
MTGRMEASVSRLYPFRVGVFVLAPYPERAVSALIPASCDCIQMMIVNVRRLHAAGVAGIHVADVTAPALHRSAVYFTLGSARILPFNVE